jgi:hypothetical protein
VTTCSYKWLDPDDEPDDWWLCTLDAEHKGRHEARGVDDETVYSHHSGEAVMAAMRHGTCPVQWRDAGSASWWMCSHDEGHGGNHEAWNEGGLLLNSTPQIFPENPDVLTLTAPLPCLICGKELEPAFKDGRQPYGAVMCSTPGNYGSTVFDSINGTQLEFNICDECLKERADRILLIRYKQPDPEASFSHIWEPDGRDGDVT